MRAFPFRTSVLAVALSAVVASSGSAQEPSRSGAWDACKAWVKKQLYEPQGLGFPRMGQDQVEIEMISRADGPRFVIRSHAILSRGSEQRETLPFTCTVGYGTTLLSLPPSYSLKRLVLPDSTVALPGVRGG
jgi:hypothetical protein